jgi:ArsR family transcriptional regulator
MVPSDVAFRACADRTRLRILGLLRGGELCVGDLMSILRVPQAKTSRHLAYLRRAGLVRCREQGLWSFYSLAPARDGFHRRLMRCVDASGIGETDRRRAASLRRKGGCCP